MVALCSEAEIVSTTGGEAPAGGAKIAGASVQATSSPRHAPPDTRFTA
jgi:hypothetical protein